MNAYDLMDRETRVRRLRAMARFHERAAVALESVGRDGPHDSQAARRMAAEARAEADRQERGEGR